MEMSSEDEEDGQISRHQQEEEKDESPPKETEKDSSVASVRDMENIRVSRDMLVQYAYMPWFEDFAKGIVPSPNHSFFLITNILKGSWVRYLNARDENKNQVYRMCEIVG